MIDSLPDGQSAVEEVLNSITCGIGFCLSVAALVTLIVFSSIHGGPLHVVSLSVYGASLVFLFLCSTLYHCFQDIKIKRALKILDHSAIYVLIAGTYTPLALVTLKGAWGWSLFGVVWGLALAGIFFKIFFVERFKPLSIGVYLGMGWLAVIALRPLTASMPIQGIRWLAAGGVIFSLGVIFYVFKKLPFHHAIWHLFVLMGCACHFFSILFYVLPL